jgi:enamine deaminase RidA (YjgF/YER057c/UK114 family)
MIERFNPEGLARPSGFAHAVAAGGLVFLSGQTAQDTGGRIVGDGVVEQFERALANLLTALAAAGGRPGDLVALTIYIVDMDDYKAHRRQLGEVWRRLVGTEYPATAGVGVSRLWDDDALVEVSGVAVLR